MSKHLFANEKVMKQYLGALLQEEPEIEQCELSPVAKLLEQVKEPNPNLRIQTFQLSLLQSLRSR